MLTPRAIIFAALIVLASINAWANTSPIGLWKTVNDESGKPTSLVRISETNGEFHGKIEKLFRPADQEQHPICKKCVGAHKDQPILGMTILSGMKQDGDAYTGGQILDPHNGKIYKGKMSVIENGKKLNLRGYVGTPLFGRTQVWLREE